MREGNNMGETPGKNKKHASNNFRLVFENVQQENEPQANRPAERKRKGGEKKKRGDERKGDLGLRGEGKGSGREMV